MTSSPRPSESFTSHAHKMADDSSGESDEEEKAKLKEATEGALPVAIKSADATKCEKRNDFNASKLAKLLDDM